MPKVFEDLTGRRFGRLVVVGLGEPVIRGNGKLRAWLCRCSCGGVRTVPTGELLAGFCTHCKECKLNGERIESRPDWIKGDPNSHPTEAAYYPHRAGDVSVESVLKRLGTMRSEYESYVRHRLPAKWWIRPEEAEEIRAAWRAEVARRYERVMATSLTPAIVARRNAEHRRKGEPLETITKNPGGRPRYSPRRASAGSSPHRNATGNGICGNCRACKKFFTI